MRRSRLLQLFFGGLLCASGRWRPGFIAATSSSCGAGNACQSRCVAKVSLVCTSSGSSGSVKHHLPRAHTSGPRLVSRSGSGRNVDAAEDLQQQLGSFLPVELIGEGQPGVRTYRARCIEDFNGVHVGEEVALKFVTLRSAGDWKAVERIQREADTLRGLQHPGIPELVGAFEVDTETDRGYVLAQRLAKGRSLRSLQETYPKVALSPKQLYAVAEQLLETCAYLASRAPPVVHRDISPSNLVIDGWEAEESLDNQIRVALVDFGAAVLSSAATGLEVTTAIGTFGFMAPESFGRQATPLSDLYSVGVTLLYAAIGCDPGNLPRSRLRIEFRGSLEGTVWSSEVWFLRLLDALMQPNPEDRPSSAAEALTLLRSSAAPGTAAAAAAAADLEQHTSATAAEADDDDKDIIDSTSAVEVETKGSSLLVRFQGSNMIERLFKGAFGSVYTGFTAVWTLGVLEAGAPFMALFALPFFIAGGSVLREAIFGRQTVELQISPDTWQLRSGNVVKQEGPTDDLVRAEVKELKRDRGDRSSSDGTSGSGIAVLLLRGAGLGTGLGVGMAMTDDLEPARRKIDEYLRRRRPWVTPR